MGKYERRDVVMIDLHTAQHIGIVTASRAEEEYGMPGSYFAVAWFMDGKWFHSQGNHEAPAITYIGTLPKGLEWDL